MYFLNATYKIKIIFLIALIPLLSAKAASLPDTLLKRTAVARNFEPHKIMNTAPNYSIIFDESGIMFLGQKDKISIYNGTSWSHVRLKGEVLLARNANNVIYFAGENAFGYLFPDSAKKFIAHQLNDLLPKKLTPFAQAKDIKSIDNYVYFQTDSFLVSYNTKTFKVIEENFLGGVLFVCGKKLLSLKPGNRISAILGSSLEGSYVFSGPTIRSVLSHADGYLIIGIDNKCYVTNSSFIILSVWPTLSAGNLLRGVRLNADEYLFTDDRNALMLCGNDGKVKSRVNISFVIPNSEIIDVVPEASGNIFILQERSITRIEFPFSVGQIASTPDRYGRILDAKSYDNKLYIATTNGLFYLESFDDRFIRVPVEEVCYRLIPTFHGLLAITTDRIFLINRQTCTQVYSGKLITQHWDPVSHKIFISEPGKIKVLTLYNNHSADSFELRSPVSALRLLSIDSLLWVSDGNRLFRYNGNSPSAAGPVEIALPDSAGITEMFKWQNKFHFISGQKVYSLSGTLPDFERSLSNEFINDEFLGFSEDSEGNSWFLSRNRDKNSVLWFGNRVEKTFTKIVLPQFLNLSNSSFDYLGDRRIIMSAGRQVFLVDLALYNGGSGKFETIINEITAGESTVFQGVSYDFFRVPLRTELNNISYRQNNVRIRLSSTNYRDQKLRYQFYLKGNDKNWSEWSSDPFINLTNMREGHYNLEIRSKDQMGNTSDVTSLLFRIKPPFYRSWWAYMVYILIGGVLFFIGYKTYLLNLHKARSLFSSPEDISNHSSGIPIVSSNGEHAANQKKFDFFSNIDEEKVKEKTRWDKYEMVTVLFSDIQGFTKIAESMNPELLIDELDRFFFHFDSVVEKFNIEKIKTIGDAYMAAGGIPKKSVTSPVEVVLAALEMQNYMKQLRKTKIDIWDLRIGIHSGPVIAGIIGHKKRSFDIWGDTVNTASRMESTGEAGKVNISSETYKLVKDYFICEYRGKLPVKYKGNIDMYFVKGLRPELSVNLVGLPNRKFFLKLQMLRMADVEELVFSKLEAELHKDLLFHSLEYARHLYEYSGLLTKAANLDLEDELIIKTSVLLLNVGYTGGYENQENRSAEYARLVLQEFNYSEKQITQISNLILSTKWPPEPKNLLEMVLYDVKMEFVGRADYLRLYKLLFLEQNQYLKSVDVLEFKRTQLEIVRNYIFYTDSARRLREIPVEEQLSRIQADDWK